MPNINPRYLDPLSTPEHTPENSSKKIPKRDIPFSIHATDSVKESAKTPSIKKVSRSKFSGSKIFSEKLTSFAQTIASKVHSSKNKELKLNLREVTQQIDSLVDSPVTSLSTISHLAHAIHHLLKDVSQNSEEHVILQNQIFKLNICILDDFKNLADELVGFKAKEQELVKKHEQLEKLADQLESESKFEELEKLQSKYDAIDLEFDKLQKEFNLGCGKKYLELVGILKNLQKELAEINGTEWEELKSNVNLANNHLEMDLWTKDNLFVPTPKTSSFTTRDAFLMDIHLQGMRSQFSYLNRVLNN